MYPGQTFEEFINQSMRDCVVIAENGTKFLYEYEMPNGTSCIRNELDKPVPYKRLSRFWLRLIEDQYGLDNLLANPQQGYPKRALLVDLLRKRLTPVEAHQ